MLLLATPTTGIWPTRRDVGQGGGRGAGVEPGRGARITDREEEPAGEHGSKGKQDRPARARASGVIVMP